MIPSFEDVMATTSSVGDFYCLQPPECEAMYRALCILPDFSTVVEVGCDQGRSSSIIHQVGNTKAFLSIHVDPWFDYPDRAKKWMHATCELCAYHPTIVLRMKTEKAEPFIKQLTPDGIDFAFIDGCHDQPVVERDLEIIASRVKIGGLLAAHDYPSGGVTEAIDPFVASGWSKMNQAMGFGLWKRTS